MLDKTFPDEATSETKTFVGPYEGSHCTPETVVLAPAVTLAGLRVGAGYFDTCDEAYVAPIGWAAATED